jgi:hypothetical protein
VAVATVVEDIVDVEVVEKRCSVNVVVISFENLTWE